jgi:hypothetical protein
VLRFRLYLNKGTQFRLSLHKLDFFLYHLSVLICCVLYIFIVLVVENSCQEQLLVNYERCFYLLLSIPNLVKHFELQALFGCWSERWVELEKRFKQVDKRFRRQLEQVPQLVVWILSHQRIHVSSCRLLSDECGVLLRLLAKQIQDDFELVGLAHSIDTLVFLFTWRQGEAR